MGRTHELNEEMRRLITFYIWMEVLILRVPCWRKMEYSSNAVDEGDNSSNKSMKKLKDEYDQRIKTLKLENQVKVLKLEKQVSNQETEVEAWGWDGENENWARAERSWIEKNNGSLRSR